MRRGRALQRHLAARGYRVDEAHDVGSALTRWAARRPDVILLDLGLPDRDGTDLIRRVRREAETPILVLSARDAERTKVEALELGADDYVDQALRDGRAAGPSSSAPAPRGGSGGRRGRPDRQSGHSCSTPDAMRSRSTADRWS